jgi:hypothetical protein
VRREAIGWERAGLVRDAAAGWRRAGAIDGATEERVRALFDDPRPAPSAVWRALTAVLVTAVVICALGAVAIALRVGPAGAAALALVGAAGCAVAAEWLESAPRHARRGAAGAAAFWAVGLLAIGLGLYLTDVAHVRDAGAIEIVLAAAAVAWAGAGWRWGHPAFAALAAIALFLLLAHFAHARLWWLVAGAALAALAAPGMDRAALAPSHRGAATVLVIVGIAAAYAAVNVYSLDARLVENVRPLAALYPAAGDGARTPRAIFLLSALGTAVFPLLVLWWGLRSRRTAVLDAGIVLAALSLVTARHYVHVAPLWAVLAVSGAALVAAAAAAERALRRAPGGEIAGLTADPLFSDEGRLRALEVAPVVAGLAPSAPASADRPLGGGTFGGGGASDRF